MPASWISPGDVGLELDIPYPGGEQDERLERATEAVAAAVERRHSGLDYSSPESVPADIRAGALAWAAVMVQSRSAPSGFAGYDAETALVEAGSRRAEIFRLLRWRAPVVV